MQSNLKQANWENIINQKCCDRIWSHIELFLHISDTNIIILQMSNVTLVLMWMTQRYEQWYMDISVIKNNVISWFNEFKIIKQDL